MSDSFHTSLKERNCSVRPEVVEALQHRARLGSHTPSELSLPKSSGVIIYLDPFSIPCRIAWFYMLQHNIPHEVLDVHAGGREMLRCIEEINPLRTLPIVIDGDVKLFGCPAVVQYLAERYGEGKGLGCDEKERALADSIVCWAAGSLHRNVVENLVESHLALEEEEDPELYESLIIKGQKDVEKDLKVLQDKYLAKKKFLFGEKPLLADYYVAMTLTALDLISFKWQKFPKLRAWMNSVRKQGDVAWETVCRRHDMQVMQRASRRASLY